MTAPLSDKALAEIEAGLEGVTPGPYVISQDTHKWIDTIGLAAENCWSDNRDADAAHFSRCDPDTIRELCRLAKIGMEAEREPVFDLRAFSRENRARSAPNSTSLRQSSAISSETSMTERLDHATPPAGRCPPLPNCDRCGRFVMQKPGVSWAQSWSYDSTGCPELHDPRWRCATCTKTAGPITGNCAGYGYDGLIGGDHD